MLLITVPHARREDSMNHDEGAINVIPILKAALDNRGIEHMFLVGDDTFRGIVDLNRGEARSTEFVEQLRQRLLESLVHIDLHSFPFRDEYELDEESITVLGDDLREWSRSDVVFLSIPTITDEELLESLISAVEETHTQDVVQGGLLNFISVYAAAIMDVPTVLVELNEGSSRSYHSIAEALAAGVEHYLDSVEIVEMPA